VLQHGFDFILHAQKYARQVNVDDALPFFETDFVEHLVTLRDTRVVERAVEPPEFRQHLLHHARDADRVVFDLDPDPSMPWSAMIEAALLTKVVLDELGLVSFPKTSGGKGLHIIVPLTSKQSWDDVKAFSQAVARHMARVVPARFSAVSGLKNRQGKVFIDYLRNSRGASTVAPFSVRARPGMAVSMPVSWDEVESVTRADEWTMRRAVERQRTLGADTWDSYWRTRQGITAAMRRAVGMKR
jgi:bifunctional non-homologous end joining protein LigD